MFNQHASSIVGDVPPDVAQPQVWIEREQDLERANVLLERLNEEAARVGSARCRACGEESPASFDLCGNCGVSFA